MLGSGVFQAAQARADFALLDYSLKRGGDVYAAAVAPYYYWGSRQARNFAIRLMQRPQMLVAFQRYKAAMKKENQRRGLRARFEGAWEVPGMEGVYIDPTAMLFPFADIIRTDTDNASESRSLLANIYEAASQLGFRPGPWIDIPIRASNMLVNAQPGTQAYEQQVADVGKGSIGSFIPQSGMIKGATALAGIGPAGGVDIERPVRQALGLSEAQPFEPYLVGRAVRDLTLERGVQPGQQGPYLLAQALIATSGDPTSGMTWSKLLSGEITPQAIAQQFATSGEEAQMALQIVRDAANRAAQQKGISTLASGFLGQRMQVLPQGEAQFLELQRAERAAAYNPVTGVGSRADVEQVRAANPALAVARAQYATLPGEETDATKIYQQGQRDTVNAAFDALKDAVIKTRPWDRKMTRAIEEGRSEALGNYATSGVNAGGWQDAYQKALAAVNGQAVAEVQEYRPRSLVGANPAEARQIRMDEAMRFISATRPDVDQFATSGGYPDWNAYNAAVAAWEAQLPQIAQSNPLVAAVVQQAEADGFGGEVRQFLAGVSLDDVHAYWRRNDSPVEAAQRAWFEKVYDPAVAEAKGKGTKVNEARLADIGPTDTEGLTRLVMQVYPNRWSQAELEQALGGMSMPDLQTVVRAQMSPSARANAEKRDQFMEYVKEKWGARGVKALTAYEQAEGADAKAKVRRRYSVLQRVLAARTEFMHTE